MSSFVSLKHMHRSRNTYISMHYIYKTPFIFINMPRSWCQCFFSPMADVLHTDVEPGLAAEPSGTMVNVTPSTDPLTGHEGYNYLALICGVPLILIIILGNVLVCLSVLTERSLKTATNYFIVSLAVADLLLAVLVLPLYVYSEVNTDMFLWKSGVYPKSIKMHYTLTVSQEQIDLSALLKGKIVIHGLSINTFVLTTFRLYCRYKLI